MNIFWLCSSLIQCAAANCDQHVVKIPLEITQMLFTVWTLNVEEAQRAGQKLSFPKCEKIYKKTHSNHPLTKWVRESEENYLLAAEMGLLLCEEYARRFGRPKKTAHGCKPLLEILRDHPPPFLPRIKSSLPPQCMPDQYKHPNPTSWDDLVDAYRKYYVGEKMKMARYTKSEIPQFSS